MPAENLPEKIGPYQITGLLGRGGMGAVYKAFKPPLTKRFVAVKIIKAEFTSTHGALERFRREAALAAELKHPNIVTVYDYEEAAGGDSYIVTELIEGGQTLKDRLLQGSMSLDEISTILKQVASALDYAYESHHIVHRDIKPSNIFIDGKRVALGDFGIAKDVSATTQLTSMGEGVGTPDYMSPEQAMGEQLDRRSDVYSLGIMAFEMITGSVPFKGDTPISVVMGHIQKPVPSIRATNPGIPVSLESVLTKALGKKKEERYDTAGEFTSAFEAASKGLPAEVTQIGFRPGANIADTAAQQNEINAVSQGLNLVTMLESQGRYQDAFDQLANLQRQYPQAGQISSRYQAYASQGYKVSPGFGGTQTNAAYSNTGQGSYGTGTAGGFQNQNQNFQNQYSGGLRTATPPPGQFTPYPSSGGQEPRKKSSPLPLVIGGIAAVVVVGIIVGLIAIGGGGNKTPTAVVVVTGGAVTATGSAVTTTNGSISSNGGGYGPVKQDGYVVSIKSVEKPAQDSLGSSPKAGNEFLALDLVIGSEKSSGVSAKAFYAALRDSKGKTYDQNFFSPKKPDFGVQSNIPSGQNVEGWLLYEVPQGANDLIFTYSPISSTNTKIEIPLNNAGNTSSTTVGNVTSAVNKVTPTPSVGTITPTPANDNVGKLTPDSSAGPQTAGISNNLGTVTAAPTNDPAFQLNKDGNTAYDKADYAGAADKYLQAVKLKPNEPIYHNNLGLAYIKLAKYDLAENEERLAISLDTSKPDYFNNLGVSLSRLGKKPDAEQAYRSAIALSGNVSLYHSNLAGVLLDQNKYTDAATEAQTAIDLDPKDPESYSSLGQAYQYGDNPDYARAEQNYRKSVELAPNSSVYNYELAEALYDERKYTEAETFAHAAVKIDPQSARAQNALGLVLEGQKRIQEAADAYKQATVLSPQQATYFRNLAHLLNNLKKYSDAQAAIKTALTLEPNSARGNSIQGDVYYAQANYKDALTFYLKAVNIQPDDTYNNVAVGDTYYQLKDNVNAKKYYQAALAIDPNDQDAQSGLKRVGG